MERAPVLAGLCVCVCVCTVYSNVLCLNVCTNTHEHMSRLCNTVYHPPASSTLCQRRSAISHLSHPTVLPPHHPAALLVRRANTHLTRSRFVSQISYSPLFSPTDHAHRQPRVFGASSRQRATRRRSGHGEQRVMPARRRRMKSFANRSKTNGETTSGRRCGAK